jgi:hypothetical protein
MKIYINLFLIWNFILISTLVNGQRKGVFVGVNYAVNIVHILNKNDRDEGGLLDFQTTFKSAFGINFGYQISSAWGVQSGILFSGQGQEYSTAGIQIADYNTALKYIKIPLLLKWNSNQEKLISFTAQVGFQSSILTSATSSRERVFYFFKATSEDVENYYAKHNLDLVVGPGLQLNLGHLTLIGIFRMDISMTDIEAKSKKPGDRNNAANLSFGLPQLSLNYSFGH